MSLLRLPRLRRLRVAHARARAARTVRKLLAATERSKSAADLGAKQLILHLAKMAAERPVAVQSGQCALCGQVSLILTPFSDEFHLRGQFAGPCARCEIRTLMVGATHAGR